MTDEQLREIEERANAATPGPWGYDSLGCDVIAGASALADIHENNANGEFIAHAREDIPALIAEIRELQQANLRLSIAANGY